MSNKQFQRAPHVKGKGVRVDHFAQMQSIWF